MTNFIIGIGSDVMWYIFTDVSEEHTISVLFT